jgi:phenylacetate-CoA ligase
VRVYVAYRRAMRAGSADPEAVRRLQEMKLRILVDHAYATVPYYRRLFDAAGIDPADVRTLEDLTHVPVTTKAALQAAGEEERLSSAFPRETLVHGRTSGATGRPLVIYREPSLRCRRTAAYLRALVSAGYRLGGRVLFVSRRPRRKPAWRGWLKVYAEESPERLLEALNRHRPSVLYGYVTPLRQLARFSEAMGADRYRPSVVVTTAETLDLATRTMLQSSFDAPVFDLYGSAEFGTTGWECQAKDGYHLSEDTTIVELLPVTSNGLARLVMTSLDARAMPLIRYEIGDLAQPAADRACACGCQLRRLARIEGRLVDSVRLRSGELLSPFRLTVAVQILPGLRRYQIVQEAVDAYVVRVEPARDAPESLPASLKQAIRAVVGDEVEVQVETVASLDPPPGQKFRVVECRLRDPAGHETKT